jgi:hypothetical protein
MCDRAKCAGLLRSEKQSASWVALVSAVKIVSKNQPLSASKARSATK